MNLDRKPRSNSILDSEQLTEDQRIELRDMMLAGASHADCKRWLADSCSVAVKSGDTLTRFYKRHCLPIVRENRKLAAVKAEAIVDGAGRTDWNAATMELVKQVSFEMMSGQALDAKTAEKFVKLVLKADYQDQTRDKARELARTKSEAGLDALFAEVKGNAKAEAILKQLREVIAK